MNPCTIVGNVGGTPELNRTPKGSDVCNFSIASYGGKDEAGNEITTWVRVAVWGELAEVVASRVGKGDKVQVSGILLPVEVYQKQDGTMGYGQKMIGWKVTAVEWSEVELMPVMV